jgi:hypothetical protein
MANTLTGLIPTLYEAMNIVSREMIGIIPGCRRDSNAERAALNQTVRVPIGVSGDLEDITPGVNPAATGDTTVTYADVTISKSKAVPIRWNGEEQKAVGTSGQYNKVLSDQFADAMRKLANAIEVDLASAGYKGASRAYGTPGTAPFGTAADFSDFAQIAKILGDNGCPPTDRQLALNSAAIANLRAKQSVLFKVNEAGTDLMLREGIAGRVQGFAIRESAGFSQHVKGTGANYVTNLAAALAKGDKTIAIDTGSGTVLAGDVVTFADDANKYIVNAGVDAPGSIVLAKPGLLAALADGKAMTIGNSFTPNLAFDRNALVLVARAPAVPDGGDSADDAMTITDPISGLTFEVRVYRQYRQVKYEIALAWGVAAVKPEHIAVLLG